MLLPLCITQTLLWSVYSDGQCLSPCVSRSLLQRSVHIPVQWLSAVCCFFFHVLSCNPTTGQFTELDKVYQCSVFFYHWLPGVSVTLTFVT